MNGKKELTTWEAACIITGYGIGSGVMSMPYLAEKTGMLSAFLILLVAYAASYVLHMMIADLSLKTGDGGQIISCLNRFLFRGKWKVALTVSFFILMLLILFTNLTGYITGSGEILTGLTGLPLPVTMIIFYGLAAVVVLFGLKAVGISEKYTILVIYLLLAVLAVASFLNVRNEVPLFKADFRAILAYYGMAMFSLSAFFSVPQAVTGLSGDPKKIRKAVSLGFLNNLVMIVIINYCSLLSSETITEVAMTGWSRGIGLWAEVIGGLFTVLAMLTTYWSLSLALSDIVTETLKTRAKLSWIIATLPSLLIAFLNPSGFMGIMRTAGGLVSIMIAVMVVPSFIRSRKEVPGSLLRHNGSVVCALIILAYLLMGIGSIVPVS